MHILFCRTVGTNHFLRVGDTEYLAHYCAETHHWLAVRWVEPLELYCFYCGDFQYR